MSKTTSRKVNNAGFSLVELLVSIAILAIVSAAAFEFVIVALNHYQKGTAEVDVQQEAQMTMNQLQDLVIDASKGISYTVNGSTAYILSDGDIPAGTVVANKQITLYNADRYFVVEWSAADRNVYYSEYSTDGSGTWTTEADRVLMAEYVTEFSIDLSSLDRNNSAELDLLFDNDRQYQVIQKVTLRNQVAVNKTRMDLYGS